MNAQDLKNSILQLAVQGKLVEQRPEEESLTGVIDEIRKNLNYKKKKMDMLNMEDVPYDIPVGWCWVRLGEVAEVIRGLTFSKSYNEKKDNTILVLRGGNIDSKTEKLVYEDNIYVDSTIPKGEQFLQSGDCLIVASSGTKSSVGKSCCIENIEPYISFGGFMMVVRSNKLIESKLLSYHIKLYRHKIISETAGYINNITNPILNNLLIPLPPLAEQKRIVAKIEELLPYIEQYDKAYTKLETFNKKFPEDMKRSILQMAMQGKLVEQRPEEGTADELYEQIIAEKARLIKEGKIKKEKPLAEIAEDEIPFEIPASWKWVRFSSVMDVRDGTHDSPKYHDEGIPLVTSKNISGGGLDFSNIKYISQEDATKINERSNVDTGDILFAMIGSIGNPVIVNKDREFCVKNVALFKNFAKENLDIKYVYWFLFKEQYTLKKVASGGVQSFIALNVFRNYLMPLPPLAEQNRIVAKLEQMLPYCDRLIK